MTRLTEIKLIGGWVKWFDRRIGEIGIQKTLCEVFKSTGTDFEVNYEGDSKMVLKKDPVIIVGNHPHDSDILALLGAIPQRSDLKIIANSVLVGIGPNIDGLVIPVYIHCRQGSKPDSWLRMKVFGRLHTSTKHDAENEKILNRQSIATAGKFLDKGGAVIIMPTGGGVGGKWFSGVAHMWSQTKNPKKVKVVMAKIEGPSDLDYLRLIPFVSKILPKYRVLFSTSYNREEIGATEPKEMVALMQAKFEKWAKF